MEWAKAQFLDLAPEYKSMLAELHSCKGTCSRNRTGSGFIGCD